MFHNFGYSYNPKRGGKRKGAGRPKLKESEKKEQTKVMRIPNSIVDEVIDIINKYLKR